MTSQTFPLTTVGTVDWTRVFDDPEDGFISRIDASETPESLRATSLEVLQALHTRDGDQARLTKLTSWIDTIVPEHATDAAQLPQMKSSVIKLVRDLKIERESRAQRYLEKGTGRGKARRDGDADIDPGARFPLVKAAYALIALVVIGLLCIAYLN